MNPRTTPLSRIALALFTGHLLLSACTATAHVTPGPAWPEPRPPQVQPPQVPPLALTVPNFQAPSADHCARPVVTREVPGMAPEWASLRWRESLSAARGTMAKSAREEEHHAD